MEDDLWGKMTLGGRRPSVEEDLLWKMNFSGRQPSLDPCMLPALFCGIFLRCEDLVLCKNPIFKVKKDSAIKMVYY